MIDINDTSHKGIYFQLYEKHIIEKHTLGLKNSLGGKIREFNPIISIKYYFSNKMLID